jgi:hypothetical protein
LLMPAEKRGPERWSFLLGPEPQTPRRWRGLGPGLSRARLALAELSMTGARVGP